MGKRGVLAIGCLLGSSVFGAENDQSLDAVVAGSEERMPKQERIELAGQLMTSFAGRTGLSSDRRERRYLWTDAFAVCTFLGLARETGEDQFRELGLELINDVHHELGQHRSDSRHRGWLNDASEQHPTRGGLRIGKPLPERGAGDTMDERREWDRDGQYFHYLTKWMHALDQAARVSGRSQFNLWARELAAAAHDAFVYDAPRTGAKRMYWKMSIDLSRPLISAMGHHDPLDGFVTTVQLLQGASMLDGGEGPDLEQAKSDYRAMIEGPDWTTDDPLGLGGLLMDAYRVEQLIRSGYFDDQAVLDRLLASALKGLERYGARYEPRAAARFRQGFRELGLAIGLAAADRMAKAAGKGRFGGSKTGLQLLEKLRAHRGLQHEIESFWINENHRNTRSWMEHRDINEVMLATSLWPDGCLVLAGIPE